MIQYGIEGRQVVDFGPTNVGLLPTFLVYVDFDTLTPLVQPVVYEIGGGTYYFDVVFPVPDSTSTTSLAMKITAGGVSIPLVVTPQPINTNSGAIRELVDLGDSYTGVVPVFAVYQDLLTQEALSPQPDIAEIDAGLYYFTYEFPIDGSPTTTEIDFVVSAPIADPLSISPNVGATIGGLSATVTGTGFAAGATVTLGGDAATVGVITGTTIAITTPAHALGAVDVVVTNPTTSPSTLTDGFTYYPLPGVVLNLVATPGDTVAALSWDPPANAVAAGVTSYHIVRTPGSVTNNQAGTTLNVTGLTNGVAYTWNVNAVGTGGSGAATPVIATPASAAFWRTTIMPDPTAGYGGVVWASSLGYFIAVGGEASFSGTQGRAATTPDGLTWTSRTMVNGSWFAVAWSGSLVVAVGHDPATSDAISATSAAGTSWSLHTGVGTTGQGFQSIAFGAGIFVATTGAADPNAIWTSTDGITWTARTGHVAGSGFRTVVYAASLGLFVVANQGGSGSGAYCTSPDGITWTARTYAGTANGLLAVNTAGTLLVGYDQSTHHAVTSTDGITWTAQQDMGQGSDGAGWSPFDSLFVFSGAGTVTSSGTGAWTTYASDDQDFSGMGANGTALVAVGGFSGSDAVSGVHP